MGRTRRISLITARLDSSSFLGSSDASATLAMDSLRGTTLRPDDRDAGFAEYTLYTLVYLLALGCLLAAMLGASPLAVGWNHAQEAYDEAARTRLVAALPLFIGTAAAYVASLVWNLILNNSAARSFGEAYDLAARQIGEPQARILNKGNADALVLLNDTCGGGGRSRVLCAGQSVDSTAAHRGVPRFHSPIRAAREQCPHGMNT